jgi:cytochrome c-type biogenesis protein CcmH/NrfG
MPMTQNGASGTVTLARLYAQQGHWRKAAAIYRSLLQEDPDRTELRQALAEAESRLAEGEPDDLAPLFREWIELLFRHDRLRRLKRLKRRL